MKPENMSRTRRRWMFIAARKGVQEIDQIFAQQRLDADTRAKLMKARAEMEWVLDKLLEGGHEALA